MDTDKLLDKADRLKSQAKHLEAIRICEKILFEDSGCVEALEEIGDNYISLHELDRAERALQRALTLDPDSANASYLMGFLHSCERAWKKSIEYLDRADELKPNHPEILRCLGWSLFQSGERSRGIVILERARALAADDLYILTDLGVCYLEARELDKALEVFREVLRIDPGNKKATECLAIIEEFTAGQKRSGPRRPLNPPTK